MKHFEERLGCIMLFPHGSTKTVGKGKNRRKVVHQMDPDDACSMVLSSAKSGTRDDEMQNRELIAVRFVASVDWLEALKGKFKSLRARRWKFPEHLKPEQLEKLKRELPEYALQTYPLALKSTEKKKKRKQHPVDETDDVPTLVLHE